MKLSIFGCALALVAACSTEQTDIGDVTVGKYTLHVFREGPACTAGAMTDLVLKPTAGGTPSSVVGWVGDADATGVTKVTSSYDSNDGDFDTDITCPNPLPTGAKFFFTVDGTDTGSIDLK